MTGTFPDKECPICKQNRCSWGPYTDGKDAYWINCEICGQLDLSRTAHTTLDAKCRSHDNGRERLRYAVKKLTRERREPLLGSNDVERLIKNTKLPQPIEQTENLIYWLGQETKGLGDFRPLDIQELQSVIGGWHEANVDKLLDVLIKQNQILKESFKGHHGISLTYDGWNHYAEIKKGHVDTKRAFMAMPFGNDLLDDMYKNTFKPAAEEAGFSLERIDESPRAGLIDSRMRNEIRNSRFVVAELTDGNLGAYFEAGLAEGFGKPVIYTCRDEYFDKKKTHFDTNHHHTIKWNENKCEDAFEDLCSTIRSTLPVVTTPAGT